MHSRSETILFYVQHLLGVGHVRRIILIAQACLNAGHDVHLVLGGDTKLPMPLPDCPCHTLPPIQSSRDDLSTLVNMHQQTVSASDFEQRSTILLSLLESIQPAALVIEMFPFGRRQFSAELEPVLAEAQSQNIITLCSIRDILVQPAAHKRESKNQWIADKANQWFDEILVHGDPNLITLDKTFPIQKLDTPLYYTGLVAPTAPPSNRVRSGIVVSAGGGAVGYQLLRTALLAASEPGLNRLKWTIITGPNLPKKQIETLQSIKPSNAKLIQAVPDLPAVFARHALSISQSGYNTVCDLLASQTPAILVPFSEQGQGEQQHRAEKLAELSLAQMIPFESLSVSRLIHSIQMFNPNMPQNTLKTSPETKLNLQGAIKSASRITRLIQQQQSHQ